MRKDILIEAPVKLCRDEHAVGGLPLSGIVRSGPEEWGVLPGRSGHGCLVNSLSLETGKKEAFIVWSNTGNHT